MILELPKKSIETAEDYFILKDLRVHLSEELKNRSDVRDVFNSLGELKMCIRHSGKATGLYYANKDHFDFIDRGIRFNKQILNPGDSVYKISWLGVIEELKNHKKAIIFNDEFECSWWIDF